MHRPLALALIACAALPSAAQFALQGDFPDLELTTVADGLNFPLGMAELEDGSLLVGLSNGTTFYSATSGRLVRLVDTDDDGIAEMQQTLVAEVPGASPTAVRRAGDLVFVTGQGQPIVVYRTGAAPSDPLTLVGQFTLDYGGQWQHKHSALAVRPVPDVPGTTDLFFQIGSAQNFAATEQTVALTGDFGLEGALAGDSVYRLRVTDAGDAVTASDLEQIASGLRNASGLTFHPTSGDLYIAENGIDGLEDADEQFSADEINVIPADALGGAVEDFGFPSTYVVYRTGEVVGDTGEPPFVVFQPVPDPKTGDESEGPNDIAFAPPVFEPDLAGRLFVGFHGRFGDGGLANEENPLVVVDIDAPSYIHLVSVDEPGVGHLDGLLARGADLFIADLTTNGRLGPTGADQGAVYRLRYTGMGTVTDDLATAHEITLTAHPNPFRDAATLTVSVEGAQHVRVTMYDVLGREVAALHDGPVQPTRPLSLRLAGRTLPNGLYVVRAEGERFRLTRRILRIR